MIDCLNDLVGIYSGDCDCAELTQDENLDKRFFVLDDMKWSIPLEALDSSRLCGDSGLIALSTKAMNQAREDLLSDFTMRLDQEYNEKARQYNGAIGQPHKATGMIVNMKDFFGVMLTGRRGYFNLKTIGIQTGLIDEGNYTYNIKTEGEIIHTGTIELLSNTMNTIAVDYTLDLSTGNQIYIYIESNGDVNKLKDIKYKCSCSDDNYKKIIPFTDIKGISSDDADFLASASYSEYTNGFVLDGVFKCSLPLSLCAMIEDEKASSVLARMYQMYAIQSLGAYFLKSTNINRFTSLSKESIASHMEKLQEQITWRLDWLLERTSQINECWGCTGSMNVVRGRLRS